MTGECLRPRLVFVLVLLFLRPIQIDASKLHLDDGFKHHLVDSESLALSRYLLVHTEPPKLEDSMDDRFENVVAVEDGPRYTTRGELQGKTFTVAVGYSASHDGWAWHVYAARRIGFSEDKINGPASGPLQLTKEAAFKRAFDLAYSVLTLT